jgi:hypothetical protein
MNTAIFKPNAPPTTANATANLQIEFLTNLDYANRFGCYPVDRMSASSEYIRSKVERWEYPSGELTYRVKIPTSSYAPDGLCSIRLSTDELIGMFMHIFPEECFRLALTAPRIAPNRIRDYRDAAEYLGMPVVVEHCDNRLANLAPSEMTMETFYFAKLFNVRAAIRAHQQAFTNMDVDLPKLKALSSTALPAAVGLNFSGRLITEAMQPFPNGTATPRATTLKQVIRHSDYQTRIDRFFAYHCDFLRLLREPITFPAEGLTPLQVMARQLDAAKRVSDWRKVAKALAAAAYLGRLNSANTTKIGGSDAYVVQACYKDFVSEIRAFPSEGEDGANKRQRLH